MRLLIAALAVTLPLVPALAQEHNHHPPEDQQLHATFYSKWMMPDAPNVSCCNGEDCAPAEAKMIAGRWWAKRRADGKWLLIPEAKIETRLDSPDGRSHLCAQAPSSGDGVYCFLPAGGT